MALDLNLRHSAGNRRFPGSVPPLVYVHVQCMHVRVQTAAQLVCHFVIEERCIHMSIQCTFFTRKPSLVPRLLRRTTPLRTLRLVTCVLAVRLRVPGLWLWLCVMCVKSNLMSAKTQCPLQISAAKRPAQIGLTGRLYKEFAGKTHGGPKISRGGNPSLEESNPRHRGRSRVIRPKSLF